jgi:hypothetical protein
MSRLLGKSVMVIKEDNRYPCSKYFVGKIGTVVSDGCILVGVDFYTNNFKGGDYLWSVVKDSETCYGLSDECLKIIG